MLKTTLLVSMLALAAAPAVAQTGLDQIPNGVVRGMESENTSGQVGEVALFAGTRRIIANVNGTTGKREAVTINRGGTCGQQAGPLVATLGTLRQGRLTSTLPLPADRLLSGNYNVLVHNNSTPSSAVVACGHLYH